MIKVISDNRSLYLPLLCSLLFFTRKGIQYLLLGNYIPMLFVSAFTLGILLAFQRSERILRVLLKVWAIIIILWSVVRIFIAVVNLVSDTFDEYHLVSQFSLLGIALSIVMLALGIMILKNARLSIR